MSDDIQHIDVDSDEFEGTPKALRDHVKKLQKSLSAATQTITEFRSKETDSALTDVLAGYKNPSKVKADLLRDSIDPLDPEAVKSWFEKNADDYAKGEVAPAAEPAPAEPGATQEDYDRLNVGNEFRQPASVDKVTTVIGQITPEMDGAAVAALYARNGI